MRPSLSVCTLSLWDRELQTNPFAKQQPYIEKLIKICCAS